MKFSELKYPGTDVSMALLDTPGKEAHVVIRPTASVPDTASQIKAVADAAEAIASDSGLVPVFKRYFLSDVSNQAHYLPAEDVCARSVIQQPPLDGSKVTLLMILEENADFRNIGGGIWKDSRGRLWAGDNDEGEPADSRTMTVGYLENLGNTLSSFGASLEDNCLRTWFFVRDIDNNYRGVVAGRNEVFSRTGLTSDTHFIASTGIAGQSADPSRLVAFNAYADTRIKPGQMKYLYGKTHLNPTYEYGVAFERGTAVDYADRRHVYISGTASIDNKGNIVAPGDIKAQTMRMLENIEVLLAEGKCGWGDVAHMIVYLRDISDFHTVSTIMHNRFPLIPKAIVLAPVCRPGWLIETECMALRHIEDPDHGSL